MSRPTLRIARPPAEPARPSLSLVKKAIKLFKGRGIAKATYRRNALAWLKAHTALGDGHLLKGATPKWGQPGQPRVDQVMAPRRLGGR